MPLHFKELNSNNAIDADDAVVADADNETPSSDAVIKSDVKSTAMRSETNCSLSLRLKV